MGHYTKFRGELTLKPDTPIYVIDGLRWLLFRNKNVPDSEYWNYDYKGPDGKDFWSLPRATHIGCNFVTSHSEWDRLTWPDEDYEEFDKSWAELKQLDSGEWFVVASSYCKNYESQIEEFCKWLQPYRVDTSIAHIGYVHCDSGEPSPIYSDGSRHYLPYNSND